MVWSVSLTKEQAESQISGDLGGFTTIWLVEKDKPELNVCFRDATGGPAWYISREIWFQRHRVALDQLSSIFDQPVAAWNLQGIEGEVTDPFWGHDGGKDVVFPWPQGKKIAVCPACQQKLMCFSVINGNGAPGWFTNESGVLVLLFCPEHWYEDKGRIVQWVSCNEPSVVVGTKKKSKIHSYIATTDRPCVSKQNNKEIKPTPEIYRLENEQTYDFLICYGRKLGGVPHWIQSEEIPRKGPLKFIGQLASIEDFELGDSGLIYIWYNTETGDFVTRIQCY